MTPAAALALNTLRATGWAVAVHNDYRQDGEPRTFWLFTHHDGVWAKGEGATDEDALRQAVADATAKLNERAELLDMAGRQGAAVVARRLGVVLTPSEAVTLCDFLTGCRYGGT